MKHRAKPDAEFLTAAARPVVDKTRSQGFRVRPLRIQIQRSEVMIAVRSGDGQ